jgi:sugar O-acyltransferase (sialic acid O-acetyltransferase NeuD family)
MAHEIPTHVILIGGGGHALVVAEAATEAGIKIDGFVDDTADPLLARLGVAKHLGPLSVLGRFSHAVILCVGDVAARRRLAVSGLRLTPAATVVHPAAWVSPSATLGAGVFVGPRAVVHTRARIGDHAIINSGAIIEHECVVGAHAHVAPGAVLGGNVSVGPGALVGLGARVLPGVLLGDGAVVGAGAVVVRDVGNGKSVRGVPAV